jgi:L-alanine-DL-glutamate epimerase-like enolase superfamily enzyme
MIIAKIETIPLRIPFKAGARSASGAWGAENLATADQLLVKVTTDQGVVGWGEAFGFRAVPSAKLAIDELNSSLSPDLKRILLPSFRKRQHQDRHDRCGAQSRP